MPSNEVGKVRQSNVVMNYGPGAIVDFRVPVTGAAVSLITAGLEQWAEVSSADMKSLTEPRLAEKLGVKYFRMPPVTSDNQDDQDDVIPVKGVRFPQWLQCPRCHTIQLGTKWGSDVGNPSRYCSSCSKEQAGDEKVYVVPVRFVSACRNGHLDDFPWAEWVHGGSQGCSSKKFTLKPEGPGLAGLILSCPKCSKRRSMESIFSPDAHQKGSCSGARPWLVNGHEECNQKPMTMQRGASNIYFPLLQSALVIPPWSEEIIRRLGYQWSQIASIKGEGDKTDRQRREEYIDLVWQNISEDVLDIDKTVFKSLVEEKIADAKKASSGNLRWDEYQQFMVAAAKSSRDIGNEFEVRVERAPDEIPHLSSLLRVVSLREIRVLQGFTRIEPLPGQPPVRQQYLSHHKMGWLPAIEVRGEGIFVTLDSERLESWTANPAVTERAAMLLESCSASRVLNPDNNSSFSVTPSLAARYLLIHSLAHVLMKQLSLQCGYSSASLRERLYIGEGEQEMAGLMIYTSTNDADGTLGGLQRQGKERQFTAMFREAIRASEWCSSDPLCIKGLVAATESSTLAACHSCLIAPETSCEDFNRFLDRAMLVGTPEDRGVGFFSDLCSGQ